MVRAGGRKQLQASSNPNSNPGSFDADKAMSPLSSFMSMLAPTPVGPPNNSFTNSKEPVEESSEESEEEYGEEDVGETDDGFFYLK